MKKIFALAWLGLTLSAVSAFARDLPPEMLLRERCHQGECTFTKITTKRVIKKNAGGSLVEVKSRSVVIPAPKSDSEAQLPAPDSFGLVRVSYAYCSTEKPGIIFYDNKKFYVHVLNIAEPSAGYLINSQIEYWAACHERIVSVGDVMEGKLAKEAADHGYHKVPEAERGQYKFKTKKKALRFFGL